MRISRTTNAQRSTVVLSGVEGVAGREAGGRVMVFEISHVIHFKRKEVTIHKEHHVPADGAVCAVSITQIKRASVTNRGFEIRGAFLFFGFGT